MQAGKNRDKIPQRKHEKYAKTHTWTQVEKANRQKANRNKQTEQPIMKALTSTMIYIEEQSERSTNTPAGNAGKH